jgi:hypothetical protein
VLIPFLFITSYHDLECTSEDVTNLECPEYDIAVSGAHSPTFAAPKENKGIHGVWASRLDDLLALGIMPMKICQLLEREADAIARPLLPSL